MNYCTVDGFEGSAMHVYIILIKAVNVQGMIKEHKEVYNKSITIHKSFIKDP